MSGATPSLEAVLTGAAFVACLIGLVIVFLLIGIQVYRRRRCRKPSQAEMLGQMIIDAFRGDFFMAWNEVLRIKGEHEMLERIAAQRAAGMPVVSNPGGRLQ